MQLYHLPCVSSILKRPDLGVGILIGQGPFQSDSEF